MRRRLVVRGVVQGVGFRPFVRRAAVSAGVTGWVRNERDAVRIEVQGAPASLDVFEALLLDELPKPARIAELSRDVLADAARETEFLILSSQQTESVAPSLPPDLAMCAECSLEIRRPGQRRYRYPFTTCALCGPRYSITLALPYDRESTTMRGFQHCAACAREYADMTDRRYHAQASACPACGPELLWEDPATPPCAGKAALARAVERLALGEIIALQGLGGFQLLTSASDDHALRTLRQRKQRPHQPFAVMFQDIDQLERHAVVSDAERQLLLSAQAPIVLLQRLPESTLSEQVSPQLATVGALLPYTPLHALLMETSAGPLVCTSGNRHGEPLCTTIEQARTLLGPIADGFLHHERPIARPVDDSLVRMSSGGPLVLRRARGYAPLAVAKLTSDTCVLGLGAHLKNTVALAHRGSVLLSQHVGDLESLSSRQLLERTVDDLCGFFRASPDRIACDLHPDYASTRFAERLAQRLDVPIVRVQHHHAHVAAVMAEFELDEVVGLAWDGTGFGRDGSVWGGELLRCRGAEFTRTGHLAPFPLPGGDRVAREPRRAAVGLLAAFAPDQLEHHAARWFGPGSRLLLHSLERGVNAPWCSSMGRLFDGVAALIDVAQHCTFEGQAAMKLEQLAASVEPDGAYELPLERDPAGTLIVDPRPLLHAVLHDRARATASARIARRFHEALIESGLALARAGGLERVALSGGCFQNRILVDGLRTRLAAAGLRPILPKEVPLNDGGISLGQVYVASNSKL